MTANETPTRRRGAPSKLTPEVTEKICEAARLGLKWASCAWYAGVSPSTLAKWRDHGEKQKSGKFLQFLQTIEAARAEGEMRHVGVIKRAALDGDWKASETALRLMYGYETPSKLSINGELRHQHSGGVLVAPAETTSAAWAAIQQASEGPEPPQEDDRDAG